MISIAAVGIEVPLARVTGISTRLIRGRHFLLIRLRDNSTGIEGFGYTYVGSHGSRTAVTIFQEVFAPLLNEMISESITEIWEKLYAETLLIGRGGLALRVLSAIDIALWDLRTREMNVSLAAALGGRAKGVPAYASGGYFYSGVDPIDSIKTEMKRNVESGFTKHKIKVGGHDLVQDAKRVAAAFEVLPMNHELALDANNAYVNSYVAAKALEKFELAAGTRGLWWFEEPLGPSDVEGHSFLKSRFATPIASGEILQTRHEVRPYIDTRAVDFLQIDAGVIGGITEFFKVAQAASVAQMAIAPHWHANLHGHLATALENCVIVEHFLLEKDIYNFEILLTPSSRMQFSNGEVLVENNIGLGLTFDEEKITRFKVADFQW